LREARERQGLTLDQVAAQARIPRRYLEALENDDTSAFPKGPFLSSYLGQYRRLMGVGEAPAPRVAPHTPEPTVTNTSMGFGSRRMRWGIAIGALGFVALWLLVAVGRELSGGSGDTPLGEPANLTLLVSVVEPVKATVVADGRPVFKGALSPGPQHPFEAHDRLEISLATLDQVTLIYRDSPLKPLGTRLKPLGEQGSPRRLVFIDDGAR
jgi:hypothetical protein